MRLESVLIATSTLFSSTIAWKWAKEGIASMTWYTDYSHENLACNCVPNAMVVGPTVALAEVAYGAFDHFGSGPACGLCKWYYKNNFIDIKNKNIQVHIIIVITNFC